MHCRIDFMDMASDSDALDRLADGLNDLWDRGIIQARANEHDVNFMNGIHWAPQFLPWHRHFLLRLEQDLQDFDARIVLPYWDWTRADSQDLDAEPWKSFFGGRDNTGGRFDHWSYTRRSDDRGTALPSLATVASELDEDTFAEFREAECSSIHFAGHNWIGGTMGSGESPLDPMFYLHHGNVDRLWAIWQLNNDSAVQYDTAASACDQTVPIADLNDPMVGGATPASMLDHKAVGYRYPRDRRLEIEVAGNPAFPNFLSGDPVSATLVTPQVVFNDVPADETVMRAALVEVETCEILSFAVESVPTGNFSLFESGPFAFPTSEFPSNEFRVWIMFTGAASSTIPAGGTVDDPGGTMTLVGTNSDGDEILREDIDLIANTIARPSSAVALVLDESGSMLFDAGNNRVRIDVLRDAAKSVIDLMYDDNGLTLVSFANTADKLTDLVEVGPLGSAAREDAKGEVDAHGPPSTAPLTSIGAGLEAAATEFDTAPNADDYDIQATVVFTDGIQTTAPSIDDVAHLLTDRVYAVGIADADNVANDTLEQLASGRDGFMLVTGALAQDDEFLLEKFFIQVLVGVTNQDIVRDPKGWLRPGSIERIPFAISDSDYGFDTIALNRAPQYVLSALEAPDGTVVQVQDLPAGAFRVGHNSNGFRVNLPVVINNKEHWAGEWHLLMTLGLKKPTHTTAAFASTLGLPKDTVLPYEAIVHARSNLHMRVAAERQGLAPGLPITLRARITEFGQPLRGTASVSVLATEPDSSTTHFAMQNQGNGIFRAQFATTMTGAHRFRVMADGLTARGRPFTREQLATALVGRVPELKPGGGIGGTGPGPETFPEDLCRLIECFEETGVITDRFDETLKRIGIDRRAAMRCLKLLCKRDR